MLITVSFKRIISKLFIISHNSSWINTIYVIGVIFNLFESKERKCINEYSPLISFLLQNKSCLQFQFLLLSVYVPQRAISVNCPACKQLLLPVLPLWRWERYIDMTFNSFSYPTFWSPISISYRMRCYRFSTEEDYSAAETAKCRITSILKNTISFIKDIVYRNRSIFGLRCNVEESVPHSKRIKFKM